MNNISDIPEINTDKTEDPSNKTFTYKEDSFPKKDLDIILREVDEISVEKMSNEILDWLITNVENYIDNSQKIFKLNLVLDSELTMLETKKMQDLYKSIPDIKEKEKEILECKDKIDTAIKKVFDLMTHNEDKKRQLFKRLVFYYEIEGIYKGVPLIQEKEGVVEIVQFEYEPFDVEVKITDKKSGEVSKSYVIPEGFTVWIELSFSPKKRMTSLF